jgi:bacterioferritin-associated ferredoxin
MESASFLPEDTPIKKWGPARVIYTQDKAQMMRNLLNYLYEQPAVAAADRKKFTRLIGNYIEHVYALWSFGYSDYVFKLGDMGIDPKGSMITVDLGEFTSDINFMERAVGEKWWYDNANQLKTDFPKMPPELEEIYLRMIDEALTVEELRKRWGSAHLCGSCSNEADTIAAFISTQLAEIDYIDRL